MGDPKKQRKKFEGPRHPWEAERIKEEKVLSKEYGLKNKKELWKMNSLLKKIKARAKQIIANKGNPEVENENEIFLKKLCQYNYITPTSKIEDVLDMKITDILERRLQTQLFRKNLTKTIKQARQFIVHGHVLVNNKKMDVPSYLINKDEEFNLTFSENSPLIKEDHPERVSKKEEVKTQLKVESKDDEKPTKEEVKEEKDPKEEKKVEEKPKEEVKEEKDSKEETKVEEKPKEEVKEDKKSKEETKVEEKPKEEVKDKKPTKEEKKVEEKPTQEEVKDKKDSKEEEKVEEKPKKEAKDKKDSKEEKVEAKPKEEVKEEKTSKEEKEIKNE